MAKTRPFDRLYGPIVMEATGCSREESSPILDVIRCDTPTLDHLTREQIREHARIAHEVWVRMGKPAYV